MKLYIGNLPYGISDEEVESLFRKYGNVVTMNVIKDHYSGKSKGFAFVEMATRGEGHKAMETLNKMEYRHRTLVCKEAIPQKKGRRR